MLVDDYIGLKDYFQAHTTIDAIKENVTEQWVLDEVAIKEANLNALENPQPGGTNDDIEIDLVPEEGDN